jgi:hypothetical protein
MSIVGCDGVGGVHNRCRRILEYVEIEEVVEVVQHGLVHTLFYFAKGVKEFVLRLVEVIFIRKMVVCEIEIYILLQANSQLFNEQLHLAFEPLRHVLMLCFKFTLYLDDQFIKFLDFLQKLFTALLNHQLVLYSLIS